MRDFRSRLVHPPLLSHVQIFREVHAAGRADRLSDRDLDALTRRDPLNRGHHRGCAHLSRCLLACHTRARENPQDSKLGRA